MEADGFDWDEGNADKCQKHGVLIDEIEVLFYSSPFIGPDFKHSDTEERFHAVGRTATGRAIIVTFTWRKIATESLIRPISARFMHPKEVEAYEKALSGSHQ